jgi:hypothetical protein
MMTVIDIVILQLVILVETILLIVILPSIILQIVILAKTILLIVILPIIIIMTLIQLSFILKIAIRQSAILQGVIWSNVNAPLTQPKPDFVLFINHVNLISLSFLPKYFHCLEILYSGAGRHDILQNDIPHNDAQHNSTTILEPA